MQSVWILVMLKLYQKLIFSWTHLTLGYSGNETHERSRRFIKVAAELVQSVGISEEEVLRIIKYVYSRPVGHVYNEFGGTAVTLLALAQVIGVDVQEALDAEVQRICRPEIIEKVRKSQERKIAEGIGK